LKLEDGTLYASPAAVGPTALVFVGRARVLFQPRPAAEREQLRQFSGRPALDAAVRWLFVRLHPADFRRVVEADRLEPEPDPEARRAEAERVFRERAPRSFLLDTPLPRSPWWLLPGYGDALVEFPWRKRRTLTYALSSGEAEDVNLFDRDRRLQVCVYPSQGRPVHYNEDARRVVDVLDQELSVRFEPERFELSAVHTMRVRPLGASGTLRLRLDDDLHVTSVRTGDGTNLLFFRVRDQDSLVVSLGGLAEREEPITLVTRYSGRHDPAPVDQELLQLAPEHDADEAFVERPPIVYSNRTAWYPRPPTEEFAPATLNLDTPEGWLAVTGGELRSLHTEARRTRAEFRLSQPGKFMTAVVGRLSDMGLRQEDGQSVRGYATPRVRSEAAASAQLAQEMLAFYATRFGPCPYPSVGLVLAEGETPGGHSPPGLVYLQRRPLVLHGHLGEDPANFSDLPGFFLAHELAHQWWGQGTAPGSYRERWLSEAWAQYAAALWLRQRLGEDAFRSMMDRMARWAFRDDAQGPISLGQRLGSLRGDPRIFRAVVYDKGAWVIHMLRGIVGDEAFFRGSRRFLEQHRFAKATSEDLRSALEAASGRDLRPYFERWVYDTGLPLVEWSARTEAGRGGFRTTVEARARSLPGPVPLEIALENGAGRETRRVVLDVGGGSWSVETRTRPHGIALNEDRGLLARFKRVGRLSPPAQR
ncbi:MAG: M1 family metallopeptidase, partial [Betaproteobacteria bacterium]